MESSLDIVELNITKVGNSLTQLERNPVYQEMIEHKVRKMAIANASAQQSKLKG